MATVTKPIALDESFNTTEVTPRNIADVLAEELSRITGRNASQVEYDNTESGLDADNVQDALDEINGKIPTVPSVDVQTAVDEFETYNGGLLSSLKVTLVPVQSGSGDPSPDNVRPIIGHTQVKINNGKNLIGLGTRLDGFTGTVGFETNSSCVGYYFKTSDLPDVVTVSDVGGNRAYIAYFNQVPANGVYEVSKDQSQQTVPKTFTVDKTAEYVHIQLSYGTTDVTNIQIEEGSTATPYVPYNGYQVTVNLGGTYYSGVRDVVTGVFVPDTAGVDLGSLTWTYQSNYPRFKADAPSDIMFPSSSSIPADAICDIYETVSMDVTQTKDSSIGVGLSAYPYIYTHDTRYTDANAYKTAMSGVMLVYKLATPTPIQLSPTTVKALVGENHLSAPLDGQEITESKYKQTFTFDDVIAYIQSL